MTISKFNLPTILIIASVLFLSFPSNAQTTNTDHFNHHLEISKIKSKQAKRLLIIGGSGIVVGTSAVVLHSTGALSPKRENATGEVYSTLGAMTVSFIGIGGGAIGSLISIPKFISANRHKKKAAQFAPIVQSVNIPGNYVNTYGIQLTF